MGFPNDTIMSPQLPTHLGVKNVKCRIFNLQMTKLCCKVSTTNSFQPQISSSKCLEVKRKNVFRILCISMLFAFLQRFQCTPCYKHCINETAASICMCDSLLENLLNSLIWGKFISGWRTRPTTKAVSLVQAIIDVLLPSHSISALLATLCAFHLQLPTYFIQHFCRLLSTATWQLNHYW